MLASKCCTFKFFLIYLPLHISQHMHPNWMKTYVLSITPSVSKWVSLILTLFVPKWVSFFVWSYKKSTFPIYHVSWCNCNTIARHLRHSCMYYQNDLKINFLNFCKSLRKDTNFGTKRIRHSNILKVLFKTSFHISFLAKCWPSIWVILHKIYRGTTSIHP